MIKVSDHIFNELKKKKKIFHHISSPKFRNQPGLLNMHSATLNDDIFLNSLEHFTISGIADHLPNFLVVGKLSFLCLKIPRLSEEIIQILMSKP